MRILIDGRPLLERERCGVGTYALEMIRSLAESGAHELTIWGSGLTTAWPDELKGAKMRRILSNRPNKVVNVGFSLLGWPRIESYAGKADLVYLPNLNFLATNHPYVVTVHDLSFLHFPEFFPPKGRAWHQAIKPDRLIREAAHVIAVSEHTKLDLQELFGVPAEKISVASPGVGAEFKPRPADEVARLRRRFNLPEKYFLFVGAIEPRKNVEGLIDAFDQLSGEEYLVIAGGRGWLNRRVYDRAARSPKSKRIHFLGYVPAAVKPALYSGARALIYPSFYEGFGIPPVEAMACGTPVIASHVSSIPEVVSDAGLLVNPHDTGSIVEAMAAMTQDDAVREKFRSRGLERAKKFTWENSARVLADQLNKIQT